MAALLSQRASPSAAADMETVLAPYQSPGMGILFQGVIIELDAMRLERAVASATKRFPDHYMRAIALNSAGGSVVEALKLAAFIRQHGFVTVIPEGATCVSACVLLFAAGTYKIASPGSSVGVHGASIEGNETSASMAATTGMAQAYAKLGVPASVIGKMVATPPDEIAWLSARDIAMFRGGVVQRATATDFPWMFAGYDGIPLPRRSRALAFEDAGKPLPLPSPPSPRLLPHPPHTPGLLRRGLAFAEGYAYASAASKPACKGSVYWRDGCISALDWKSKSYYSPDTRTVPQLLAAWLAGYDGAYETKAREGACGNGSDAGNDGCRAGAKAWPRLER